MVKKHLHRFTEYCSQRMLAIGLTLLVIAAVGGLVYATVVINGCQLTDGVYSYRICERIFPVSDSGNIESPAHNYREITLPLATAPGWSGHSDAGKTYRITTTSGNSYFIPYKSTAEWDAFKVHKPADLSLCGGTGSCTGNVTGRICNLHHDPAVSNSCFSYSETVCGARSECYFFHDYGGTGGISRCVQITQCADSENLCNFYQDSNIPCARISGCSWTQACN